SRVLFRSWAAMNAWENSRVDGFFVLGFHHDYAATWATQRFVRGGSDKVSVRHGIGVGAASHQARIVGDIDHKQRTIVVSNFGHALKVDLEGVGGSATHNHFGLVLLGERFKLVVVEFFVAV